MDNITQIVVVGAGRMGRGIAHMFSAAGRTVTVLDMKQRETAAFEKLVKDALDEIEANMGSLADIGAMRPEQIDSALSLIMFKPALDAGEVLKEANFIIEAVPETREAKRRALGEISKFAADDALITSTTSTMLVTELQAWVTFPERFLNTHFLNPAYLVPLVEVSAGPDTGESAVKATMKLFEAIGKVPVRCSASPGYIVPRLQALLLSEACRMVEEGVATPEDIDKAILAGFGPRYATMGVMEFLDWGGLDILLYAGNYLAEALDSPRHAPPSHLAKMIEGGRGGMREGRGYYDYRQIDVGAYQREKLSRFVTLLKSLGWMSER